MTACAVVWQRGTGLRPSVRNFVNGLRLRERLAHEFRWRSAARSQQAHSWLIPSM